MIASQEPLAGGLFDMATLIHLAAALVMLAPAVALGAEMDHPNTTPSLDGTSWVLVDLPGFSLTSEGQPTLNLASGQVHGSDGCNRYRASYAADASGFRLTGPLMSTKMACPGPVMQQAARFTDVLERMRAARMDGERLVLLDGDARTLAILAAQRLGLAGTAWKVTGYNNGKQAVVSLLRGSDVTLAFAADGGLSGSGGCNRYRAAYSGSGGEIRIGQVAATRKLCASPDGVMAQEAAFLQALERAAVVRIDGDRLELRDGNGALQVTATRAGTGQAASARAAGAAPSSMGAHGLSLPATFRGDLPCADCEAIRHHLDLWPDQVFHLHREWVGRADRRGRERDFFVDDIGRWRVEPARDALVLQRGTEMPLQFEIKGPDRLRALDIHGKPIASNLPYELTSDGTLEPADLSLFLGGELRYLADAARFTECLTGRSYPVAMEADWIKLERAYLEAVGEPGGSLYVTFEGDITARQKMEGEGTEPTVVVRRFVNVWPGMRCERARADASLTNTYWRIVRLGERTVGSIEGHREPHLVLRAVDGREDYRATVGCNQMLGSYAVAGESLSFSLGPSTLMACPPPLDELEQQLGQVLAKASRWRINANTLEFFDAEDTAIALFEAVYF